MGKKIPRVFRQYIMPIITTAIVGIFWHNFNEVIPLWWILAIILILFGHFLFISIREISSRFKKLALEFEDEVIVLIDADDPND